VERLPEDCGAWGAVEHSKDDCGPWGADKQVEASCGDKEHAQAQECGPQSALEHLGPWAMVEIKDQQEVGGPTCGAGRKRPKTAKVTVSKKAAKIAGPWGALLNDSAKYSDEFDEVDRRVAREREKASRAREKAWSAR
jgi:hypothetical protein